jgi:hypothetical protein
VKGGGYGYDRIIHLREERMQAVRILTSREMLHGG